jgi:hypothetical protein
MRREMSERRPIYFECDPERHVCRTATCAHKSQCNNHRSESRYAPAKYYISLSACASQEPYTRRAEHEHTHSLKLRACVSENAEMRAGLREGQQ